MKKIITTILLSLPVLFVSAQTARDSIKAILNNLFVTMKNSDGNAVKIVLQKGQSYKPSLPKKK